MIRKYLVAMMCCLPIASMAQQADLSIRDALKLMPDSLVPYLTLNNRLDMIDFMDAKMKAAVDNALTGETEMVYLSDDSLAIKMSEASLLTMKVVKQDTASVIVMHRTYNTKGNQHETVTQTFDSNWLPLSKPVVESTLLRRDDEIRNLPHF